METHALFPWFVAVAGLVVCFRGYSTFRVALGLTAFLVGAHVAVLRLDLVPHDPAWLGPVVVAAVGLLAALLVFAAYRLGVILLGMIGLVALTLQLPVLPEDPSVRLGVLVVAAVAGGVLAGFLERVTLTLLTAAYGAFMVVSAATGMAHASARPEEALDRLAAGRGVAFVAWAVLTALGAAAQHRVHFKKKKEAAS